MADDVLGLADALSEAGEPFALATVVRCERPTSAKPGAKALVRRDGTVVGWIGGSCAEPVVIREGLRALQDGRPRFIALVGEGGSRPGNRDGVLEYPMTCHSGGTVEVFIEPVLPKPDLVLVGRGPVAESLAGLSEAAGFTVVLAPESPLRIPPRVFVVVVTHGTFEEEALEQALQSDARYVSLVTSRKRAGAVIDALRDRGVPEDRLRRLKAPAGLDIGAVTPDEIAISNLAEIVQVSRSQMVVQSAPATDSLAMDPVCGMAVEIASARYARTCRTGTSISAARAASGNSIKIPRDSPGPRRSSRVSYSGFVIVTVNRSAAPAQNFATYSVPTTGGCPSLGFS